MFSRPEKREFRLSKKRRYCGRSPTLNVGESGMSSPVLWRKSSSPNVHVRRVSMKPRPSAAPGGGVPAARAPAVPAASTGVGVGAVRLPAAEAARAGRAPAWSAAAALHVAGAAALGAPGAGALRRRRRAARRRLRERDGGHEECRRGEPREATRERAAADIERSSEGRGAWDCEETRRGAQRRHCGLFSWNVRGKTHARGGGSFTSGRWGSSLRQAFAPSRERMHLKSGGRPRLLGALLVAVQACPRRRAPGRARRCRPCSAPRS